jgi:hypothetical protein
MCCACGGVSPCMCWAFIFWVRDFRLGEASNLMGLTKPFLSISSFIVISLSSILFLPVLLSSFIIRFPFLCLLGYSPILSGLSLCLPVLVIFLTHPVCLSLLFAHLPFSSCLPLFVICSSSFLISSVSLVVFSSSFLILSVLSHPVCLSLLFAHLPSHLFCLSLLFAHLPFSSCLSLLAVCSSSFLIPSVSRCCLLIFLITCLSLLAVCLSSFLNLSVYLSLLFDHLFSSCLFLFVVCSSAFLFLSVSLCCLFNFLSQLVRLSLLFAHLPFSTCPSLFFISQLSLFSRLSLVADWSASRFSCLSL